jgi:phosphoglycerate dehydrogenase-like enzyme
MPFQIYVDLSAPADALELLREGAAGHEIIIPENPSSSVLSQGETDKRFYTADIAFGQPDPAAVAQAENLKWIQISSSGITRYDNPDFRGLVAKKNIAVCNSAKVYAQPCAEQVVAFMLAQSRQLPAALCSRAQSGSDEWMQLRDCPPLENQRVLILGYGAIGERLVHLLRPFDMKITAFRRQARGDEPIPVATADTLDDALAQADHVVNILPASDSTRLFVNTARLATMRQGAIFYNIGRGTTVDQDALLAALQSQHLAAAWLDVTDPEPLPADHPLYAEPTCHITPHIAGGHAEEEKSLVRHFLTNLRRLENGEALINRVM